MIDMTKFDFSQFDFSKFMDASATINQMEKSTKSAIDLIPDAKTRDVVETVSMASIEFARAQALAAKAYGDAVKAAIQTVTKTH
jgi:hypothetical protein